MDQISVASLQGALDDAALYDARVRNYSGRQMEGRYCAAVVVADVAELALFYVSLPGVIDEDQAQYLAKRTRTDQMGHEIVVYWPSVALDGEPDDD
jgi:hypothetical protein